MQVDGKLKRILLTGGGSGGPVAPLLAVADDLRDFVHTPKPAASPLEVGNQVRSEKNTHLFGSASLNAIQDGQDRQHHSHSTSSLRPGSGQAGSSARGEIFKDCKLEFLWLGTYSGPESGMVAEKEIAFRAIHSGKFRRYFSIWNLIDLFLIFFGFIESLFIIRKFKPDLILSVGGFVSVPVVWAGWIMRAPILIHQQDIRPGLANRLMAPFAKKITVTFEKSLEDYGSKALWIGNPVRADFRRTDFTTESARNELSLKSDKPVITIIGGGTGALAINNLVWGSLKRLTEKYQIIHITGAGKNDPDAKAENYHQYEFLRAKTLRMAFDLSSAVVSRCGLAVLTELSYLGKPSILIPIPDSHQEDNAAIYFEQKAAIVLDQNELTAEKLIKNIDMLVQDFDLRSRLRNNIKNVIKKGANERFVEIINTLIFN